MNVKEILVMHHSHMDIGYTHSQPMLWELQREFLDKALESIEETKTLSKNAQLRWTSEVTSQIMHWLKFASDAQKDKLREYIKEERFGISGLEYNTTPLCTSDELMYQLKHVKYLNKEFSANIKTVHQHDVNGIPWGLVDIMLDAGIELLVMGINCHYGQAAAERPSVFKWKSPSGREIFVMNGNHYTMFDQITDVYLGNIDVMKERIDSYFEYLNKINYKHDFLYLTAANAPVNYDNSPPNTKTAEIIHQWNEKYETPAIRYVTPNMLLEKIKTIPDSELLTHSGDWTDYWNFGCSCTAHETKVNANAKSKLKTAEMISTVNEKDAKIKSELTDRIKQNLVLYDEHTWGAFNSIDPDNDYVRTQDNIKKNYAYVGHELAEYFLINELEELASNPHSSDNQYGVLVVNPSPLKNKSYFEIPEWWQKEGKRHRTARLSWHNRNPHGLPSSKYGPIEMEPYSWKFFNFDVLPKAEKQTEVIYGEDKKVSEIQRLNRDETEELVEGYNFIESPFHRLEYDENTGRILSLVDKQRKWEVLDKKSKYTFFQFVRQTADKLTNGNRTAFFSRNIELEKYDISGWQTDWQPKYETANELISCKIIELPEGVSLHLKFKAPGVEYLEQKITFLKDSPIIKLNVEMKKLDYKDPESIYFTFPLNLKEGWKNHFDSAGIICELDKEQLDKSCKGWQTAETFSSIHNKELGAALICPDAPMVMAGDFNFGRLYLEIERNQNPMLIAWPVCNYWDTNFIASQPGMMKFSYSFLTHDHFNSSKILAIAHNEISNVEIHPAIEKIEKTEGNFIKLFGDDVNILNVQKSIGFNDVIVRLVNNGAETNMVKLELPYTIEKAEIMDTLEIPISELKSDNNVVELELFPRKITNVKIIKK